jgi:hypothetical protein
MSSKIGAFLVGAALCATPAFAAQNVGNTSQKGSLLMFSQIDASYHAETIIRISNDSFTGVWVKCYYMNEAKGRRDFRFRLTPNQPVWWSVRTGDGAPGFNVPDFPDNVAWTPPPGYPTGKTYRGELVCWAIDINDEQGEFQIAFNQLSGNATIYDYDDSWIRPTAFTYNSWNFTARGVKKGDPVGTAGNIQLTGLHGDYDACPKYLLAHFTPVDAKFGTEKHYGYGYYEGKKIEIDENNLSVMSCNQDLRQDFTPHLTKLQMTVWNENEIQFTGAYECSNGYHFFTLDEDRDYAKYGWDKDDNTDVAGDNFTYDVLKSHAAYFRVQGVQSTQCFASEKSGLVGVLSTETEVDSYKGWDGEFKDHENVIGTTLNSAGATPGYILWDPVGGPLERR